MERKIASERLDGDEIICPRHGARFCVKTGAVKSLPPMKISTVFQFELKWKSAGEG